MFGWKVYVFKQLQSLESDAKNEGLILSYLGLRQHFRQPLCTTSHYKVRVSILMTKPTPPTGKRYDPRQIVVPEIRF